MAEPLTRQTVTSTADDPMGMAVQAADEAKTARLLKSGQHLALKGLWCVNGVYPEVDPRGFAQFFQAGVLTMTLLAERCIAIEQEQRLARAAAGLSEEQLAKARRMAIGYDRAMADAARDIQAQSEQLELF